MIKIEGTIPTSQALSQYLMDAYPQTAERISAGTLPTMRGVWIDVIEFFNTRPNTQVATKSEVVRAITADGKTFWTLERWTKGNGYQAEFSFLTKAQFLARIRS